MKNMKITMTNKVNIDDFLFLILWIKTFTLIEGKKFNYENLVMQAETYKLSNTPLDTNIHHIDELMIDAFHIYQTLKDAQEKVNLVLDNFQIPFIDKNKMIEQTKAYERIFEDIMENQKFEDPEIRGIQKGFLAEKMSQYVAVEEYEKAAKVRDMIKEC